MKRRTHQRGKEANVAAYPARPGAGGASPAGMVTGDAVVLDLRPAGFATRIVALLLDALVQLALLFAGNVSVALIGQGVDPALTAAVQVALTVGILVGYPTAFETLTRGRSLGKLALGLRVVGEDGSPERFRQALARALCAMVEIWLLSGVPALVTSMVHHNGKRLGDFLAGTLVVEERAARRPDTAVAMPEHLAGWAATAELSRLDSETTAMARQYVLRYSELNESVRQDMGVRVAEAVARLVSPPAPPGTTPLDFLAAVLAERRRREEERMARQHDGSNGTQP